MVAPVPLLRIPGLFGLTAEAPELGPLDGVRMDLELPALGIPDRPTDIDGDVLGLGDGTGVLGRRAGLLIRGEGPGVGVGAGRETEGRPELTPGLD